MIHIIPHHIGKGSYVSWYDLINFTDEHIFHQFDDTEIVQRKLDSEPPYVDKLIQKLDKINPQFGDIVMFDSDYYNQYDGKLEENLIELSKKYNDCKFVLFDDDNSLDYNDTERYTFFSNKFKRCDSTSEYNLNCNYYKYRAPLQENWPHISYVVNTFYLNIRQKKMNMFIGVDKKERLQTFKHVYNIGLDKDSWLAYSGFTTHYTDSEISEGLVKFRHEKLPVILDTSFEDSCNGSVNVELPPLPITMTSYFSCILETMVLGGEILHLSEKSWNPFISKNIPLILGSSYINDYLKKCGFWLADDLFDLKPQLDTDAILHQYRNNLDIINKMTYDEIHQYYLKHKNNIDSNFNIIKNAKFEYNPNQYKKLILK
jgi:hypothetical protein